MAQAAPKIAVIGAGIIGASIAYHLARRGAEVTVIEKAQPAAAASGMSFAWINASYGNPKPYFDLRIQSMAEYRRLDQDLEGALGVDWCGCLSWDMSDTETEDYLRQHRAWGYDLRLVEREEIRRLEPRVLEPPERAVLAAGEGAVELAEATRTLLRAARELGAEVRIGVAVEDFATGGDRITGLRTSEGTLEADAVVVAAGVETARLAAGLDIEIPLRDAPGLLLHCRPFERLLRHVVETPGLHIRQRKDGRILAGADYGGAGLESGLEDDPEAGGAELLARIKARLRGTEDLEVERVTVGQRPMPLDGFPALGFTPAIEGLYLAVMHSGATLAPAVGRFAAMEILDEVRVELLAPFRPDRFAK